MNGSASGETPSAVGTRVLIVLLAVNIVNFIDRQLPAILAEHIKRDLRLTDTQLGLLTGLAFALVYGLAALPLARLADRWSPRNVLVLAIGFWSGMTALGAAAAAFLPLALTRTGVALGEAASTPSSHAIISRLFAPGRRGRAIGIVSAGAPLGTMLGMALGGWLSDALNWRAVLIGAGGVGLVVAAAVAVLIPNRQASVGPDQVSTGTIVALVTTPAFAWMLLAMALYGLSAYPFLAFAAAFFIRLHHLSAGQTGLALGLLQGVLGLAGTLLGGWIFDKTLRRGVGHALKLPALGLIAAAPATAAAWFATDAIVALILLAPMALAVTFFAPALFGSAHLIAGPGREATASSLLMLAAGLIGGTLGPLIVGMVSDGLQPSFGLNALRWALLQVPFFALAAGAALVFASDLSDLKSRAATA